jgi:alpha-tubulin suppressor-like RCC1 family protein
VFSTGAPGTAWATEAPTVSNVQPDTGPAVGGTPVVITGTHFSGATAVKFGGVAVAAGNLTVDSENEISVISPKGTGAADVIVTTPGGNSARSSADEFNYHVGSALMDWGLNSSGQLGNGSATGPDQCASLACSTLPTKLTSLTEVTAVSEGAGYGLALQNGEVYAWGANGSGQLGNDSTTASAEPVKVCAPGTVQPCQPLTEVVAISAGKEHALAALKSGKVVSWGANASGQLGDGVQGGHSTVPVYVCASAGCASEAHLQSVKAVAAGASHSVALLEGGHVVAWGSNSHGRLGTCSFSGAEVKTLPVPVRGLESCTTEELSNVMAIAAGESHTLALLRSGDVAAWGSNYFGQLGDAAQKEGPSFAEPHLVCAVPPIWAPYEQGAFGGCSGNYLTGVTAVAAGARGSLALLSDGEVRAWGEGQYHQLGTFEQEEDVGYCASLYECAVVPAVVDTASGATAIAASEADNYALRANGSVVAWGENALGELGVGESAGPEQCGIPDVPPQDEEPCSEPPIEVKELQGTALLAAGGKTGIASGVSTAGPNESLVWGSNQSGQLGVGLTAGPEECFLFDMIPDNAFCSTAPLGLELSETTELASASGGAGFALGLSRTGGVLAWGANGSGELADGTSTGPEHCEERGEGPAPCDTVPSAVAGVTEISATSAGGNFGLALTKQHEVLAWGANGSGQLGDNSTTPSAAPVKVCAAGEAENPCRHYLTEVVAISAGKEHALALLKTGGVVAWGANGSGQLGDGTSGALGEVPFAVCADAACASSVEPVTAIAAGEAHSLALLRSGKVVSWGSNAHSQLGDCAQGGSSNYAVYVAATQSCSSHLEAVTAIAAGESHSVALLSSGKVVDWGQNAQGELGIEESVNSSAHPVEALETCLREHAFHCGKVTGVAAIAASGRHTVVLHVDGTLGAWGENEYGQLGNGEAGGPENCGTLLCAKTADPVPGVSGAVGIAAGSNFSLALRQR